jgi:hypothetical protein
MKIVTIPIKVEVPDNAKQVAVDENGEVWSASSEPIFPEGFDDSGLGVWQCWCGRELRRCRVLNWKETLTKVAK